MGLAIGAAAASRRVIPDFGSMPTYARDYLRVLIAEYDGLPKSDGYVEPADVTAIKRKTDDRLWQWADVVTIENATLNATSDDDIAAAAVFWRERYHGIVGDAQYAVYLQSNPPDPKSATAAALRSDARAVANRIHYRLATTTAREKMRNRLTLFLGAVMIASAFIILSKAIVWHGLIPTVSPACITQPGCAPLTTLQLVIVAGLFGGFVSVQQRLQSTVDYDPLFKRLEMSAGWGSIVLIAPLIGAVSAIVLYEIFVSGMVQGPAFPTFDATALPKTIPPSSFDAFMIHSSPAGAAEWAKLGVWSFIAGFAERFVPDVLTRLSDVKNAFGQAKG